MYIWQVALEYDGYNIEVTRILEPTWDPEYIFYNKSTLFSTCVEDAFGHTVGGNRAAAGSVLFPPSQAPSRGNGILCIIELNIKHLPEKGEQPIVLNINIDNTFLLDPELNEIKVNKFNGMIQWGYDSVLKTIDIIGPTLIIECYNHNKDAYLEVTIEVYLTT